MVSFLVELSAQAGQFRGFQMIPHGRAGSPYGMRVAEWRKVYPWCEDFVKTVRRRRDMFGSGDSFLSSRFKGRQ